VRVQGESASPPPQTYVSVPVRPGRRCSQPATPPESPVRLPSPGRYNEIDLTPLQTRVLALDLGKKRIGLAISDPLGITAQGLPNLVRSRKRADLDALKVLATEHCVDLVLLGNPIHMSGDEGRQSAWVREFGALIEERIGLPVKYWDERLTTVEASRVLRSSGIGLEKRNAAVDRLSAVILLQSYLDSLCP
jgi:putative holliday junction resolvase